MNETRVEFEIDDRGSAFVVSHLRGSPLTACGLDANRTAQSSLAPWPFLMLPATQQCLNCYGKLPAALIQEANARELGDR